MAKREMKTHYIPQGQKSLTICGKPVAKRAPGQAWRYTYDAKGVTCGNCRKLLADAEAGKKKIEEEKTRGQAVAAAMELMKRTVHLRLAGSTRPACGGDGEHFGDRYADVTCLACLRAVADCLHGRAAIAEERADSYARKLEDISKKLSAGLKEKEEALMCSLATQEANKLIMESLTKSNGDRDAYKRDLDAAKRMLEDAKTELQFLREEVRRWKSAAGETLSAAGLVFRAGAVR